MPPSVLSKTNFLYGLQCHKYLWTLLHEPHSVPPPDAAMQFVFDQGHQVGDLAKQMFPGGLDVPTHDFNTNIRVTRENLGGSRPLFEAGILAGNIFCRLDVLSPAGEGSWDIIEVKSATSVKDVNILDVAFQKFCCESAGLKIRNCKLAYINNKYIRYGEINPQQLFTVEDVSARVAEASGGLAEQVEEVLAVMSQQQCPEVGIGPHCAEPYECPLQPVCWAFLPENSIFELYFAGKKRFELYENGILHMKDLPESYALNGKQQIQVNCVASGEAFVNKDSIRSFLDSLLYPVYYLDFETFSTAIPLFEGTHPYQQIPFQFSLHVALNNDEGAIQFSYLAEGREDPRPKLAAELKQLLGESGSIVAYYAPFEKQVLAELAAALPEYQEWVDGLQGRIVDLLKPFSSFHYYHPSQKGSASLKKVLPALTGISYEGLAINDGKLAGVAFMAATYGNASEEERRKIRQDLEIYCGQDTGGMVEIIKKLFAMAG
ncbi:MAG: DUF2779 domain-containing protein [Dehalococcoidia bacterium]|nr:DUF2779 domain-containing protein [Dehalococcoidia bacterium]